MLLSRVAQVVRRFVKFGGGSVLGAGIDYVATLLAHDLLGIAPAISLALAMALSVSVVFVYHERITFRTAGTPWRGRYARFLVLAVLVLALRILVLEALVCLGLPVALALACAIILVSLVNFGASSVCIFSGRK